MWFRAVDAPERSSRVLAQVGDRDEVGESRHAYLGARVRLTVRATIQQHKGRGVCPTTVARWAHALFLSNHGEPPPHKPERPPPAPPPRSPPPTGTRSAPPPTAWWTPPSNSFAPSATGRRGNRCRAQRATRSTANLSHAARSEERRVGKER